MHLLNAHCSNKSSLYSPSFEVLDMGKSIKLKYSVSSQSGFRTNDDFALDTIENWGLWEYDVIEIFLTYNKSQYLELQVSPLNQKFALLISKPRVDFKYPKEIKVESKVNLSKTQWGGEFNINKKDIPQGELNLKGSVFAILGDPREYYAINPNPEDSADFHRPELFGELLC